MPEYRGDQSNGGHQRDTDRCTGKTAFERDIQQRWQDREQHRCQILRKHDRACHRQQPECNKGDAALLPRHHGLEDPALRDQYERRHDDDAECGSGIPGEERLPERRGFRGGQNQRGQQGRESRHECRADDAVACKLEQPLGIEIDADKPANRRCENQNLQRIARREQEADRRGLAQREVGEKYAEQANAKKSGQLRVGDRRRTPSRRPFENKTGGTGESPSIRSRPAIDTRKASARSEVN